MTKHRKIHKRPNVNKTSFDSKKLNSKTDKITNKLILFLLLLVPLSFIGNVIYYWPEYFDFKSNPINFSLTVILLFLACFFSFRKSPKPFFLMFNVVLITSVLSFVHFKETVSRASDDTIVSMMKENINPSYFFTPYYSEFKLHLVSPSIAINTTHLKKRKKSRLMAAIRTDFLNKNFYLVDKRNKTIFIDFDKIASHCVSVEKVTYADPNFEPWLEIGITGMPFFGCDRHAEETFFRVHFSSNYKIKDIQTK